MVLVCQQPHYLPWLGYFDLLARADRFVVLDSVQWIRQGRQHRTKLLDPRGRPFWLTLPVRGHGHREKTLRDMEIDDSQPWARQHWQSVQSAYGRAPYFRHQVEPLLRPFFERVAHERHLTAVTEASLWLFAEAFGCAPTLEWSSDLPAPAGKNERLVSLCHHFGAEEYYSSLGSTRYLDHAQFREAGVRVRWQHFSGTFPNEPRRPVDVSVLDWLSHQPLAEIRRRLRTEEPASRPAVQSSAEA